MKRCLTDNPRWRDVTKQHMDVLYDSAAALRLVDHALRELGGSDFDAVKEIEVAHAPVSTDAEPGAAAALRRSYHELRSVLETLRNSRQLVDGVASRRIQDTHTKLKEVSATTESAAVVIIRGLERAVSLLAELEVPGQAESRRSDLTATLRDELYAAISHMQFQDITSQQLSHSAAILNDVDGRIAAVVALLEPEQAGRPAPSHPDPATYDPAASVGRSDERQALVDEVVAARRAAD